MMMMMMMMKMTMMKILLVFVRTHCKKKTNSEGNRCCFVKHDKRCVLRQL